jgi:hypothetical protein
MKYPEIGQVTKQYWTDDDFLYLDTTKSIREVCDFALQIIDRMPDDVAQVCGPITSGGKGSIEANLEYLNFSIQEAQKKGLHIFDQMPFEQTLHRILREQTDAENKESILFDFYEPLFESKKIKKLYFVPDWESSHGANWEYKKAKELGMEIGFL